MPFLFSIYIKDIFHFTRKANTCNFAADNSLYSMEDNVKEVKTIFNKNFKLLKVWFFELTVWSYIHRNATT